VREVFVRAAVLERGQWHKHEHVVASLPERHRATLRRQLQAASEQPTYEAAKRALGKVRAELAFLNASAVASFDEGFDETLTLTAASVAIAICSRRRKPANRNI